MTDYNDLSDDCRELVLYIENTEALYNQLGTIARRIHKARAIWTKTGVFYDPTRPDNAARLRLAVRNLINESREHYRAEIGQPLRWTREERATMHAFLISLADDLAYEIERHPDTFTSF